MGIITAKNLNLWYTTNHALKDINIELPERQITALIGPSGCGKSTFLKSLNRMNDLVEGCRIEGEITLDEVDIYKDMDVNILRKKVGMVFQKPNPFPMSIYDNIAYGKEGPTRDQVMEAARKAHIDSFIDALPNGYDTEINEDSTNISAGQKQLLTIARAYLSDRPILILDEATSNVDTRTELLIQQTMDELMKGRTAFVIAHRLSTIENADVILVVDNGHVVEQGKHAELLRQNGLYARIYNSQYPKEQRP